MAVALLRLTPICRAAQLHARVQTSVLCHHTALGAPDLDSPHKAPARAGDNQTLAGNAGFLLRTLVSSSGQTRPGSCNGEKPTFPSESPNPPWTPATLGLSSQATGIGRTSGKGTRKLPLCLGYSSERRGRWCRGPQENVALEQSAGKAPAWAAESRGPLPRAVTRTVSPPKQKPEDPRHPAVMRARQGSGGRHDIFQNELTFGNRSFSP